MADKLIRRVNGQIWIDKEPPYRLKYHLDGIDYVVEVAATYKPGTGEGAQKFIPAGTIVKLVEDDIIAPAIFPDDINSVIGITINDANSEDNDFNQTAISQSGYIIFPDLASIKQAFPFDEDLNVKLDKNLWDDSVPTGEKTKHGIGCPVYWFVGRTKFEGDVGSRSYTYEDSTSHPGKITFQTPSGLKWLQTLESYNFDESMNVAYDNLPLIGTVARYDFYTQLEIDSLPEDSKVIKYKNEEGTEVSYTIQEGDLKYLAIHLNFSKFDSSIEWNWPYLHSENCGSIRCNETKSPNPDFIEYGEGLTTNVYFRHGLFPDNNYYSQLASYIEVAASKNASALRDGPDYVVDVLAKHEAGSPGNGLKEDRKTIITLATPEDLNYRVVGDMHYKFDKGHKE